MTKPISLTASLSFDAATCLDEICSFTGRTKTEIIEIALSSLHHLGESQWPVLIPCDLKDEVTLLLSRQGLTITQWSENHGFTPQLVYQILKRLEDADTRVGSHRSYNQTYYIVKELSTLLGRPL